MHHNQVFVERDTSSIADECRCKLRSLSIGSELFNDENSILQASCNSSVQEHELDAGSRIGKGGFSEIIEVKNLRPRSATATDDSKEKQRKESAAQKEEQEEIQNSSSNLSRRQHHNVRTLSIHETHIVDPAHSYVIKTVRKDLSPELEMCGILDLAVEAQFLQTLSHTNIVSLYGVGDEPGNKNFFIMIERIERTLGHELDTWFLHKQRMKECTIGNGPRKKERYKLDYQCFMERRVAVAYQLSSALKYLHDKNIVYRDLKPENIGLDYSDNVKLFDFGLAKELKKEQMVGEDQYLATEKTGTQRYMAPEAFSENGVYGLPIDVYSFSVVLWEMISLRIPYDNLSPYEHAVYAFGKKQRPKLRSFRWPDEIKGIMREGWAHNPSRRPKMSDICHRIGIFLKSKKWKVDDSKAVPIFKPYA